MDREFLKLRDDGRVRLITISRPKALNALNTGVLSELIAEMQRAEADSNCNVVVLTGEGKAFVAGGDIAQMSRMNPSQALQYAKQGQDLMAFMEKMNKVVIAAINGYALGGGSELALGCDMVIAAKSAKIGQPEVTLGIMPGFGGTQRLVRTVGRNAAKEWILTGGMYSAQDAMRIGFVNRVVDDDQVVDAAMKVAHKVAANGPVAVAISKKAINEGMQMPLTQALDYEASLFANLFDTSDQVEGTTAFLEKRPPKFKGK